MDQPTTTASPLPVTLGLDLGLRRTQVCAIDSSGAIIEERAVATSRDAISELLERFPKSRIVLEASTSARWITRGHCRQPAQYPGRDRERPQM